MLRIFLFWYFIERPTKIFKAGKSFFLFTLNYFSITLLFKTLFSYWRDYRWSYGKGFDIKKYIEAFFSNLFSRVMGIVIRFLLIITGLIVQILVIIITTAAVLLWLILPFLIIFLFYQGTYELKAVGF